MQREMERKEGKGTDSEHKQGNGKGNGNVNEKGDCGFHFFDLRVQCLEIGISIYRVPVFVRVSLFFVCIRVLKFLTLEFNVLGLVPALGCCIPFPGCWFSVLGFAFSISVLIRFSGFGIIRFGLTFGHQFIDVPCLGFFRGVVLSTDGEYLGFGLDVGFIFWISDVQFWIVVWSGPYSVLFVHICPLIGLALVLPSTV